MQNHALRPEIRAALTDGVVVAPAQRDHRQRNGLCRRACATRARHGRQAGAVPGLSLTAGRRGAALRPRAARHCAGRRHRPGVDSSRVLSRRLDELAATASRYAAGDITAKAPMTAATMSSGRWPACSTTRCRPSGRRVRRTGRPGARRVEAILVRHGGRGAGGERNGRGAARQRGGPRHAAARGHGGGPTLPRTGPAPRRRRAIGGALRGSTPAGLELS